MCVKIDKGGGIMEKLTELKYDITKLDAKIENMQKRIDKMAFDDKTEVGIKFLASTVSHLKELREYKQLEEQGLLLRLPCKVGDIIYSITNDGKIYPVKATREVRIVNGVLHILCESCKYVDLVSYNDIGKTVFLTQEEAEQKLKEMNTDNGITE